MTDTIHEAPGRQAPRQARISVTTFDEVSPGTTTPRGGATRRIDWPAIRRLSLGAAILILSAAAGFLAMRWATHRGTAYRITPTSVILLVGWTLVFAIPEVVSAVRRARSNRGAADEPPRHSAA